MSVSLLLDFGASRIKSALVNDETGALSYIESRQCTQAVKKQGRFEIPLRNLTADFMYVCADYAQREAVSRILICSQMHGFVLADKDGRALTDYISWQDESVLEELGGLCVVALKHHDLGALYRNFDGFFVFRPAKQF